MTGGFVAHFGGLTAAVVLSISWSALTTSYAILFLERREKTNGVQRNFWRHVGMQKTAGTISASTCQHLQIVLIALVHRSVQIYEASGTLQAAGNRWFDTTGVLSVCQACVVCMKANAGWYSECIAAIGVTKQFRRISVPYGLFSESKPVSRASVRYSSTGPKHASAHPPSNTPGKVSCRAYRMTVMQPAASRTAA